MSDTLMLTPQKCMRSRPFAYSLVYEHPPLAASAFDLNGAIRPDIPKEIATLCKNESNCTVFFADGTWFTTWGQGSYEHAVDERIVFSTSRDMGKSWTPPQTIIQSSAEERIAYGVPFIVPGTQRVYLFFHAGSQTDWESPFYDSGQFHFIFSDDQGNTWSNRFSIELPDRDVNLFKGRLHAWLNHPPRVIGDSVVLPFSAWRRDGLYRRAWMLAPSECGIIRIDNILEETDPARLKFSVWPEGGRGVRASICAQQDNASLRRLCASFKGNPEDSAFNYQEMTIASLSDGRWIGVGRTFLGSPGLTVSTDRGETWSAVEPLRYGPEGEPVRHPMTMCPVTQTSDGRIVLLFTNNDGSGRGARHVWDGNGRTRNPQWFVVGRQIPGEERNAGLIFGEPRILAEVDDSGDANLKTGISMPQFLEKDGRYFVAYNINKEHLLLDEIPSAVMEEMTPGE